MRAHWTAFCAAMLATGMAWAADQKPPEPARPALPPSFEATMVQSQLRQCKASLSQWETDLPKVRSDELKKFLTEGMEKGKALQAILEQTAAAQQAGKQEEARALIEKTRAVNTAFSKYVMEMQTYRDIDRVTGLLEDRGKDDPDLKAHCQKTLGLLKKRLELRTQVSDTEIELTKEIGILFPRPSPTDPARPPLPPGRQPEMPAPAPKAK